MRTAAIHEAGHAVVANYLGCQVTRCSIVLDWRGGGATCYRGGSVRAGSIIAMAGMESCKHLCSTRWFTFVPRRMWIWLSGISDRISCYGFWLNGGWAPLTAQRIARRHIKANRNRIVRLANRLDRTGSWLP